MHRGPHWARRSAWCRARPCFACAQLKGRRRSPPARPAWHWRLTRRSDCIPPPGATPASAGAHFSRAETRADFPRRPDPEPAGRGNDAPARLRGPCCYCSQQLARVRASAQGELATPRGTLWGCSSVGVTSNDQHTHSCRELTCSFLLAKGKHWLPPPHKKSAKAKENAS